jgi:hypothetical protein
MNRTHIIKCIPVTLILLFTVFGIPWKQNLDILIFRGNKYKRLLLDYIDHNTSRDEYKRHCVRFVLPKQRQRQIHYTDTLKVRFTKAIINGVALLDYDAIKYSWNAGHVEYKKRKDTNHWQDLFPTFGYGESFIIPITIKNGQMPSSELFLKLLPKELREDTEGNKAQVIFN